jgi:beta-glucosidase
VTGIGVREIASRFPADFLWGVATSAYQIEGALDADGRGRSIWETFSDQPGAIERGENAAVACDHYNRLDDDLALIRDLGVGSYRFSIAWPRIQPTGTGPVNRAGLAFYDRLVDGLLAAGIRPFPTLYHWDLPQALEDAGGWAARDTAARFADYTSLVMQALGDRATDWSLFNEPFIFSSRGYLLGRYAPGRRSLHDFLRAVAKSPLEVLTVDNDRHNYFLTCRAWAENLEAARDEIIARWGETLYRRFRLYLWGSAQAFLSGGAEAFRVVLERPLEA